MSVMPLPSSTPTTYPEPTQADQDAMFASVVWFQDQCSAGKFKQYEGMYVAILGEQMIDSDANEVELGLRLEAQLATLPPNRVVVQYVHRPEDWNWKY